MFFCYYVQLCICLVINFCSVFLNFLKVKSNYFGKWCLAKKIGSDHTKLRKLMLNEGRNRRLSSDVHSFLDERQTETLEEAVRLADDYALKPRLSFVNKANPRNKIGLQLFNVLFR